MNKELRDFFDKNNIITKKITLKNKVMIIESDNNKFVIKKREKDLTELYKYLSTRSFNYYPKILYQTTGYDIYEYIDNIDIDLEEKALDIINMLTILHRKTTYYKDIEEDDYKEIYERIIDNIEYLENYYEDIITIISKEVYMSPSNYLFIRNSSKLFLALNYARYNIDKWYDIIKEKKRIRIVNIHNNLDINHYLVSDRPVFISWNKSKKDIPIYDILNMYQKYYDKLDFIDLIKNYEKNYPLLKEEKILFLVLISIPPKITLEEREYRKTLKVKKLYDYINTSSILVEEYDIKEENTTS